jgi:hypothetical protein
MRSCGYQSSGQSLVRKRARGTQLHGRGFQYWLQSRAIACVEEG